MVTVTQDKNNVVHYNGIPEPCILADGTKLSIANQATGFFYHGKGSYIHAVVNTAQAWQLIQTIGVLPDPPSHSARLKNARIEFHKSGEVKRITVQAPPATATTPVFNGMKSVYHLKDGATITCSLGGFVFELRRPGKREVELLDGGSVMNLVESIGEK